MRARLGECLVQAGRLTDEDLRSAILEQKRTREHLGVILTRRGLATEIQIATTVAGQLGLPFVNLADRDVDSAALSLIPHSLAIERGCVALTLQRHVLTLAMADPLMLGFVQDLESRTGYRVKVAVATTSDIADFIARAYSTSPLVQSSPVPAGAFGHESRNTDDSDDTGDTTDSDALLDAVVAESLRPDTTEVRIQPAERSGIVSRRENGRLQPMMTVASGVRDALIARLKQRACMDPGDRLLPQDGRLRVVDDTGAMRTFRVATRRVPFGEIAVLREGTAEDAVVLTPGALGLWGVSLESLSNVLSKSSGLVLVAAPAVGGASTTARSVFDAIHHSRSLLFGDIQDAEHAGRALTTAREGALVVAAIQADDTAAAIDRLVGLSWSPGLVAEVLAGVVAVRLAHRLCDRCRRPAVSAQGFDRSGCAQCGYTGYRGRIGLFEVLRVEDRWRRQIAQGGASLRDTAVSEGMVTLAEDALAKVRAGIVTFADVSRALPALESARPTCPACGSVAGDADEACTHCGQRLRDACRSCGKPLRPEWGACAYCATSVEAGTLLERLS